MISCKHECLSNQWVSTVSDFSSQYGNDLSLSYIVSNLIGPPKVYPKYGDYADTSVMRTYGPWWDRCPSKKVFFGRKHFPNQNRDYIDFEVDNKVCAKRIDIYETYNPGAIIGLYTAYTNDYGDTGWQCLYSGLTKVSDDGKSKVMSIIVENAIYFTNKFRIIFDHSNLEYYTEIDAILVVGYPLHNHSINDLKNDLYLAKSLEVCWEGSSVDAIQTTTANIITGKLSLENERKKNQYFHLRTDDNEDFCYDDYIDPRSSEISDLKTYNETDQIDYNNKTLTNHDELLNNVGRCTLDNFDLEFDLDSVSYFATLPVEIVQKILLYLDLLSLFRLASASKFFYFHCLHPLQFSSLDLQPYWFQVNKKVVKHLISTVSKTKYLSLSWCTDIDERSIFRLLESCSRDMKILRLDNCHIRTCLNLVVTNFSQLNELSVRSCIHINGDRFGVLSELTNLCRFDAYRTRISTQSAIAIVRSCKKLQHINFGSCPNIKEMDNVVAEFYNLKDLISVDLWRARSLTSIGITHLSNGCPKLEEIDLGWCDVPSIVPLVVNCQFLKKLFLTANRSINDLDLEAIAKYATNLQQLDILGTREITQASVIRVMVGCYRLQLIDLSFIPEMDLTFISSLRLAFSHCSIKNSIQADSNITTDDIK